MSEPNDSHRRALLRWQVLTSIQSLRRFNQSIQVKVCWLGAVDVNFELNLRQLGAQIIACERYDEILVDFPGGDLLNQYPVLHKYFTVARAADPDCSQILLVDCDTVFLSDVGQLFDKYNEKDVVASPEVGSRRGPVPYDPTYLDEDKLSAAAATLGAQFIPPFNSGVMLLNRRSIGAMRQLGEEVVKLTLRLMVGIALSEAEVLQQPLAALRVRLASRSAELQEVKPLPHPSSNHWIIEEVALWLAFGMQGLSVGDFTTSDAVLGGGVFAKPRMESDWIVGHYFSANTESFKRWLLDHAVIPFEHSCSKHTERLPVDPALRASPLIAEHSGYAVYEGLIDSVAFGKLAVEARDQFWEASEQFLRTGKGGDGRGGHPPRRMVHSGGGPTQKKIYQSASMRHFLEDLCRVQVCPTGQRGSFNYYTRAGDFIGLHLDVLQCDLVVVTVLQDFSDPHSAAGAFRLFPNHLGVPLREIGSECDRAAVTLKLMPGQSLVMFGGLVPHQVLPVQAGQARVISALCYRAGYS
ncbi:hypothetical protein [Streptomyces griseorubiginosus]|uniref:hypothetical protein n=1 Tax=Streptomyces griseorubiginosus TaxID=67304 RepID=UPI001AD6CB20|nr:hypothetical protein [Streptomyces griseorubiginosus]MBO4257167.1 hypothetical protein [Streptomyces griseorubiginosus]